MKAQLATTVPRLRVNPEVPSQLARLAVVFADPIRLRIVTELFRREMSPSQFHVIYGGGTLSRVNRHFKKLTAYGWLRLVREARGGCRRGGTEHFYRAPRLAIIEEAMWARLPPTVRAEYSWRTFEQFGERVKEAMEARTFDARGDRHLTWTPLVLDEQGRARILVATLQLFHSLLEEQADAKVRLAESGEQPMEATIGLGAFDSPRLQRNRSGLLLPPAIGDEEGQSSHFTVRIARVLANPLSMKIVTELSLREMSASGFYEKFGGAARLSEVNRRFKSLAEDGWLRKVREETGGSRRGATEHFYRATGPAVFGTREWMEVPEAIRSSFSWRIFEQLAEQVREAMAAETFDLWPDRHHTWTPLVLDHVGWEQVIRSVDHLFHQVLQEQAAAKMRLAKSDEEPLIFTVYLAAFESPPGPALRSWIED